VERAHLHAPLADHHGAGSNPFAGSPPAPFTKSEECRPLAFRGGVLEPRLPSRIPEGQGPRDQGVGGSCPCICVAPVAGPATLDHRVTRSSVTAGGSARRPLPGLTPGQDRLFRPAPHDHDQFRLAPGSSRRLVHGLAPPASGDGSAVAPGSSRSLPTVLHYRGGKWQSRYVAARSAEAEAAPALPRLRRRPAGGARGAR